MSIIQHQILHYVVYVNHTAPNSVTRYICQSYSTKFCITLYICQSYSTEFCYALYMSIIQHQILHYVIYVYHTAPNSAMYYICQSYGTDFCITFICQSYSTKFCNALYLSIIQYQILHYVIYVNYRAKILQPIISVNHTAPNSTLRYKCQSCSTKICNALYLSITKH